MNPEQSRKIEELDSFVVHYACAGKTRRQFWAEFDALAGDLGKQAFAGDAPADLLERYCEVLANADDAGFDCPEDRMDEVMEG